MEGDCRNEKTVVFYCDWRPCKILLFACTSPEENANKLFIEGSKLVEKAEESEKFSYVDSFHLYEKALEIFERIISKYPSTHIAVKIIQGSAQIGNHDFDGFKIYLDNMKEKAGEFWDTHSTSDYEEYLEPVNMTFDLKKRHF